MGKPVKKKMEVKGPAGKPTFSAQKTVMVMAKQPVFEVFRRFGDGPETSVCKLYPDSLTNPTKFYNTNAQLVYDANSNLIEVPGMAVNAVKQKIAELYGSQQTPPPGPVAPPKPAPAKPQAPPVLPKPKTGIDYYAKCEDLEDELADVRSKLAGKTAKVDTLEKQLKEAEKNKTGISQADLEERLAKQREEVDAMYLAITSGRDSQLENGIVQVRLKIKGEGQWVCEGKDGNYYFTTKDGKKFAYKPKGEYLKVVKHYFAAARDVCAVLRHQDELSEELKAKEKEAKEDPAKVANLEKVNKKYFKEIRKLKIKNEKLEDLTQDVPQGEISVLESYPLVEKSWMGKPKIYVSTQFEDCLEIIPFVEYMSDGTAEQKFIQPNGIVVRFNKDDAREIIEEYQRVLENRPETAHKIKAAKAREMPVYISADVNGIVKEFSGKAELTYNNIVYSVAASGLVDKDQKQVADQNALKLYNLYLFKKAQEPVVQQEQLPKEPERSYLEEALGI